MSIDIALGDSVHARQRHQVGVGAERVERVQLNAAQFLDQRAHAGSAAGQLAGAEPVMAEEELARLLGAEDGAQCRGSTMATLSTPLQARESAPPREAAMCRTTAPPE